MLKDGLYEQIINKTLDAELSTTMSTALFSVFSKRGISFFSNSATTSSTDFTGTGVAKVLSANATTGMAHSALSMSHRLDGFWYIIRIRFLSEP